jgi:antitoxin component YwqK of YwqJK toxin-antitoxin module
MKILVCFLFLFSVVYAQENKIDDKGLKQGLWKKYFPNTKVLDYEGNFVNDIPEGDFTYYFRNGKVKARMTYKNNGKICFTTIYHEDENNFPMAQGKFVDKQKDSLWLYWGPSGRISMEENYKNGVLDGKKRIYYVPEIRTDKSVLISQDLNFKYGIQDGEQKEYFNNGVLKSITYYKNGMIEGEVITNGPNGVIALKDNYLGGAKHGWCYAYDENGAELSKVYYKQGVRLTDKQAMEYIEKLKKAKR